MLHLIRLVAKEMAVQLSSPLKQWGGAEMLRKTMLSPPVFNALALWSSCSNFPSVTNLLKLYLLRDFGHN